MVDGEIEFERRDAFGLDSKPPVVAPIEEAAPTVIPKTTGDLLAIAGGTLHPITSPDVEGGTILIQGGRILAMGKGLPIPAGARTIQAQGKHVWPGMIALGANTGLLEIGSISSTDDQGDIGGNQPDLRVSASINADSAHIGVTRSNGITRSQTTPQRGGPMLGQSAIVRLAGDNWEEMLQVDQDMLHVRFPVTANDAKEKKEGDEVKELRHLFDEAREYGRLSDLAAKSQAVRPAFDPRLEALVPYSRGEKKVGFHVDNAQTILFALKFIEEEKLSAVLYGVEEGWKVVDAIAKSKVSVAVGPVITLPQTHFDPYDAPFSNPAVLARAGVPIAIMAEDVENERNLPFHAATAAAFGLPHEEALRAITYTPAKILGVEKELGSLAPGKIADLVVTDGDLLEFRTRVEVLLIGGAQVDLANRQTRLYERYRERLHRLKSAKGSASGR
jgi:imidazolonepropionase-like amidohydrolase